MNWIGRFLEPVVLDLGRDGEAAHHLSVGVELALMAASVGMVAVGIWIAWRLWGGEQGLEGGRAWARRFPALHQLLVNKYWIDEIYDRTVVQGTWSAAHNLYRFDARVVDGVVNGTRHATVGTSLLSGFFDKYVVDGLVNLSAWFTRAWSFFVRRLQTGVVSQYALVMAVGMFALVCFWVVVRSG